jgi:hypothetical protein
MTQTRQHLKIYICSEKDLCGIPLFFLQKRSLLCAALAPGLEKLFQNDRRNYSA